MINHKQPIVRPEIDTEHIKKAEEEYKGKMSRKKEKAARWKTQKEATEKKYN